MDSIYQVVVRALQFPRAGQTVDGYPVEFDLLRRKTESDMQMGLGYPEASASALWLQNTALSRQEKSPRLASTRESLAFMDVAMAMRRLPGSCGGAARRDILAAEDVGESCGSDEDPEARAAYRIAKNRGRGTGKGMGRRRRAGIR